MEDIKKYIVAFIINILAGVFLYLFISTLHRENFIIIFTVVISFLILITLLMISVHSWLKFYFRGIIGVQDSMTKGKGSTESTLKTVKSDFIFMGIAARKWMDTGKLIDNKIKEIGSRGGNLKFLLLNPRSEEARKISIAQDFEECQVPNLIIKTLRELKPYFDRNINVEVRLYDFMPIFRLAVVDNRKMYLGFYRPRTEGRDSAQLVLNLNFVKS